MSDTIAAQMEKATVEQDLFAQDVENGKTALESGKEIPAVYLKALAMYIKLLEAENSRLELENHNLHLWSGVEK